MKFSELEQGQIYITNMGKIFRFTGSKYPPFIDEFEDLIKNSLKIYSFDNYDFTPATIPQQEQYLEIMKEVKPSLNSDYAIF